jgi:hypothetical protein
MEPGGVGVSGDFSPTTCEAKLQLHRRRAGRELRNRTVSISSFLNGPFDTPKQGAQSGSDDLRLFKPGKVGKS